MKTARLVCSKCKSIKFIGDPYYANGVYYVDVTCVSCSDTKDIELDRLKKFIADIEASMRNANKKTNT